MIHPRFRTLRGDVPLPDTLTPVYPTTAGLSQDSLRKLVARALHDTDLSETLPEQLLQQLELKPFAEAVKLLHKPPPQVDAASLQTRTHPAWRRLKFDELLAQQLSMRLHHERRSRQRAPAMRSHSGLPRQLAESLPFALTGAQLRALDEIRSDLARPHPMQRLL